MRIRQSVMKDQQEQSVAVGLLGVSYHDYDNLIKILSNPSTLDKEITMLANNDCSRHRRHKHLDHKRGDS